MTENLITIRNNTDIRLIAIELVGQPHRILAWQPQAIAGLRAICLKEFQGVCRTEIYFKPGGELHSFFGICAGESEYIHPPGDGYWG